MTDFEDKPMLAEHFAWLSTEFMPFCMDPGSPHIPPDFTLGLAKVSDWPAQVKEPPWSLDPINCPKLVLGVRSGPVSVGPDSGDGSRRKKKHRCKSELKVTNWGKGNDSLV